VIVVNCKTYYSFLATVFRCNAAWPASSNRALSLKLDIVKQMWQSVFTNKR